MSWITRYMRMFRSIWLSFYSSLKLMLRRSISRWMMRFNSLIYSNRIRYKITYFRIIWRNKMIRLWLMIRLSILKHLTYLVLKNMRNWKVLLRTLMRNWMTCINIQICYIKLSKKKTEKSKNTKPSQNNSPMSTAPPSFPKAATLNQN